MKRVRKLALLLLLFVASCSSRGTPESPDAARATPNVTGLIRPGTEVRQVLHNGRDEIAVWSQAKTAPADTLVRRSYVDVFAQRDGSWNKVFDATAARVLASDLSVSQEITFFRYVDLKCATPYLVLGVQNIGAREGPLDLAVVKTGSSPRTAFRHSTTAGGTVLVQTAKAPCKREMVSLITGHYAPGDPMCCPSGIERIHIGAKGDRIGIVMRTTAPPSPQP